MARRKPFRRVSARTALRQKTRFLEVYKRLGNATATAAETGISRDKHKHWLERSADYRKAFQDAEDVAIEALEQEARRRAMEGREEPVYYNGVQVGTVRKQSDVLLIFLLKAKRPDIYRDAYQTRINNNLNVQTAVKVVHEYHPSDPADVHGIIETLPNKQLMAPTELPTITEQRAGQPNLSTPSQSNPASAGTGTGTSTDSDT